MESPTTVISRAPTRIDFTGGYTDVSPFIEDRVGTAVNAAISLYAEARGTLREHGRTHLLSLDADDQVVANSITDWEFDGHLDLIKSVLVECGFKRGVDIQVTGASPSGSGLGTSGALAVAVAALLDALAGGGRTRSEIAEIAALAEWRIGIKGGRQDQYASALGGVHYFEFEGPLVRAEAISMCQSTQQDWESRIVLAHPGGSRFSGRLIGRAMEAYASGDQGVRFHLMSMNELGPAIRDALSAHDPIELARLMGEIAAHQTALQEPETRSQIERLQHKILELPVLPAKPLGAGGPRSSWMVICDPSSQETVKECLIMMGWRVLRWSFSFEGVTAI